MSQILSIKTKDRVEPQSLFDYLVQKGFNAAVGQGEDSLTIYIDGVSTRPISMYWDKKECELKINILSSEDDYKLFREVCVYMLENLKGKAEFECEKVNAVSIRKILADEKFKDFLLSDVGMLLALMRNGNTDISIVGPVRQYCFGLWTLGQLGLTLDCSAEELAPLIIEDIRRVQYQLPENLRESKSILSVKSGNNDEDLHIGIYHFNEYDITGDQQYLAFFKEDFMDRGGDFVIIESKVLSEIAPKSWKRIDEQQYLTTELTEQEYIELWDKAYERQSADILPAAMGIKDYKVFVAGVVSDEKSYALLCRQLETDGFNVYPSAESIESGKMPPKERMKNIEQCDVAVLMQTRNTGRSKKYQKEVMELISLGKPFVTISINAEDVTLPGKLPFQPEIYTENRSLAAKYTDLKEDIKEMCWLVKERDVDDDWNECELSEDDWNKAKALLDKGIDARDKGDSEKAIKYLSESAEMGMPSAIMMLSFAMHDVDNSEESRKRQFELLDKAASYGILPALRTLGRYYEEGFGCEKDVNLAVQVYKFAAKLGLGCACSDLSELYDKGNGIKRNLGKALFWVSYAYAGELRGGKNQNDEFEYKDDFDRLLQELFGDYD